MQFKLAAESQRPRRLRARHPLSFALESSLGIGKYGLTIMDFSPATQTARFRDDFDIPQHTDRPQTMIATTANNPKYYLVCGQLKCFNSIPPSSA